MPFESIQALREDILDRIIKRDFCHFFTLLYPSIYISPIYFMCVKTTHVIDRLEATKWEQLE